LYSLALDDAGLILVDHRVDRALQLQDLALHVNGDLLGEVALGYRGRHLGDVAHLAGEVRRHGVDVVGEVLPRARDAGRARLPAELAVGAYLARDARDLGSEPPELVDHGVDDFSDAQKLAAQGSSIEFGRHALRQIAPGNRLDDARDLEAGPDEIPDQRVDRVHAVGPRPGSGRQPDALVDLPFAA